MIRFTFRKDLIFVEGQTRRRLVRRTATNKFQFELESGEIENYPEDEVLSKWLTQQWLIDSSSLGSSAEIIYLAAPRDLSTYPAKWRELALKRRSYLLGVDPANTKYNSREWRRKIGIKAQELGDEHPPAPSTVHGWWVRFRIRKNIFDLIPETSGRARKRLAPAYSFFEEVISEVYLNRQKHPRKAVFAAVTKRIAQYNATREGEEKIICPSRTTIFKWIGELNQGIVEAERDGIEAANARGRPVYGGVGADNILARVEIDHTPIDLLVIDAVNGLPLGRPWLTTAIDRASRMILGFYVSFSPPSRFAVLQCLRMAIMPKASWLSQFPGLVNPWPACGIMVMIVLDNGMDLHSKALEATCLEMGIQVLYCPTAEPSMKGAIERYFRTVQEDLFHQLPGTVFSSVEQRGSYQSEKNAAIDFQALLRLLTKWIVDIYHNSKHRGIGTTPLVKWNELAQNRLLELPAYPEQLKVMTGTPAERTIFHYGIEFEGEHYNSPILQAIRQRIGGNPKVSLKAYDDSISYIHVFDKHHKEYISVPIVGFDNPEGITRDIHKRLKEAARRKYGDSYSVIQVQEAREAIGVEVAKALDQKKMAQRKRAASALKVDSQLDNNDISPLAKARRPQKRLAPKQPDDLPDGIDDQLPEFKSLPGDAPNQGGER